MVVREVSPGPKAPFQLTGSVLTVGDATIGQEEIDLAAEERDVEVVIDLSLDASRRLVRGIAQWYVATIRIPPRRYELVTVEGPEGPAEVREPVPFDPTFVELYLWGLPPEEEGSGQ